MDYRSYYDLYEIGSDTHSISHLIIDPSRQFVVACIAEW